MSQVFQDPKERNFHEFQPILAKQQQVEFEQTTQPQENQHVLEAVSQGNVSQDKENSIVRGLADLQLEFGDILNRFTTQLTLENQKLEELQRTILWNITRSLPSESTEQVEIDEPEKLRYPLGLYPSQAEYEPVLAEYQFLLESYQRKARSFPMDLEEAINKAREENSCNENLDARATSLKQEWLTTKQAYELRLRSLEAKIQKQTEQVTELSIRLQAVMQQAQELAIRAFEYSPQ